jgi:hypothetical protein
LNDVFFNGLDIDNYISTMDSENPALSHVGDADKFFEMFSGQKAAADKKKEKPQSEIVEDRGPKEPLEKEEEKISVPIKASATESKCSRVRRRTDADPAPTDVGGLTMKDLTEPTIRDDANGSEVKHMGDSVIKKSTSELIRERFNRRK